ncbi:hypothetical protein DJ013_07520 [Arcticibacterium luteifluviistationis]|uniref:Uncharacterized protein n=1 Tax=Arcticibacterium luteifluviistationis TaxID=1784714 RepID=A0A2Z4G9Z3_9BACT|nr:hypothetical protein DJ013_07520 [Arcticibacterium luteifluviistationis]
MNTNGSCHFCTTVKNDVRVKLIEGSKAVSYKRNFFGIAFNEFTRRIWSDDMTISALVLNRFHVSEFHLMNEAVVGY